MSLVNKLLSNFLLQNLVEICLGTLIDIKSCTTFYWTIASFYSRLEEGWERK